MLKNIPKILSPELVKVLMEMGQGDEIVIADGNYPAASNANLLIRCDGIRIPELLEGILTLFPLDTYSENSFMLMDVVPGDDVKPVIWDTYLEILEKVRVENKNVKHLERFDFYDRGRKAYAIVATGEEALYANILLRKGVVK
jgi:L-fucose mutarotase